MSDLSKRDLGRVKKVVVKVGTSSITKKGGLGLDSARISALVEQIAYLKSRDIEVVLVSSGAISAGMDVLGHTRRPRDIRVLQALASVGQTSLMRKFTQSFIKEKLIVGQVLLTKSDFSHRERYLNARNTVLTLLKQGVVPVVNENDTVSVEEIRVGDNDNLSALTACCIEADLLVILSDIDGVYSCDPHRNKDARFIGVVKSFTSDLCDISGKAGNKGTGGLRTKIEAAKKATSMGIPVVISNSSRKDVLKEIISGECVGTLFTPKKGLDDKKHWIKFTAKTNGELVVDTGAVKAIKKRTSSLLPIGVVKVNGVFNKGDTIVIKDAKGKVIAKGVTNYSSSDVEKIKKLDSKEIEKVLGNRKYREVVFRDNMAIE